MANLSQAMATSALSKLNKNKIFSLLKNDENKAQFRSQTSPGAACVLMALPTDKQFKLSSQEFALLMSTRTFAFQPDPIGYPSPTQYPLLSANQLSFECPFCRFNGGTLTYEHILVCPGRGANIIRHNEIIYIFLQLLNFAGVQHTVREPKNISIGTNKRTDILTSHNQMRRRYDLAVISPNVPSNCKKAALEPFHAANTKFKEKIAKHFRAYAAEDADFAPLIIESTGAIHPRMMREIQALVTLSDQSQPIHHSFTIRNSFQYWTHYIAIAAARATMRKQVEARKHAYIKVARLLNDYRLHSIHAQSVPLPLLLSNQHTAAHHSSTDQSDSLAHNAPT